MARLRRASFEDRITLVEHLDELRSRIVVSLSAFAVAFTLCFWQNSRLLDIANAPHRGTQQRSALASQSSEAPSRREQRLSPSGRLFRSLPRV